MLKLFLISGNDDFAIKDQAKAIACSICGKIPEDNPALEIIKGDSDEMKADEMLSNLLGSLNTPAFLTPEKIIWLRHFQFFEQVLSATAKKNASLFELIGKISDFMKDAASDDYENVTLIIDGPGVDRRKAFYKTCAKLGDVHFFQKANMTDKDFSRNQHARIKDLCAQAGVSIDNNAISYLSETAGTETGRLKNELDKLFCYIGDSKRITFEDCREVCSRTPEALSWAFADALVAKNVPKALEVVGVLAEQMKASRGGYGMELSILSGLVRRFQEMVMVKKAAAEINAPSRADSNYFYSLPPGMKDEFKGNILVASHPFRAYNMHKDSSRFSDIELSKALTDILEVNKRLVSGSGFPRLELEQLVLRIAG